jgi:predicted SAM-dependent methyltransferase
MIKHKLPYLNIGCGDRFHPDWNNIDIVSHSKDVIEYDITKGIPFKEYTFEVVYHSHVIEHIPYNQVDGFIKDCYRILKPHGTIRIALPDLENIAKLYLQALQEVSENETPSNISKYHWMKLELLDQMVRNQSGGQMKTYLLDDKTNKNLPFIKERVGFEAAHILESGQQTKKTLSYKIKKFLGLSFRSKFRMIKEVLRDKIVLSIILWGQAKRSYQIGSFRTSGEMHQWMYDHYSIKKLLEEQGFKNVKITDAFTSRIPNWDSFQLDGKEGKVFKPDSLFVEATK